MSELMGGAQPALKAVILSAMPSFILSLDSSLQASSHSKLSRSKMKGVRSVGSLISFICLLCCKGF
mgnify:CR=1 FL=1